MYLARTRICFAAATPFSTVIQLFSAASYHPSTAHLVSHQRPLSPPPAISRLAFVWRSSRFYSTRHYRRSFPPARRPPFISRHSAASINKSSQWPLEHRPLADPASTPALRSLSSSFWVRLPNYQSNKTINKCANVAFATGESAVGKVTFATFDLRRRARRS